MHRIEEIMQEQSFAYEIVNQEVHILRCYGISGRIIIPETLEGLPVTELSAYTFAEEIEEEPENKSGLSCICGTALEELYLPSTIQKLGRYLFYNCIYFVKLSFYSNISFIGAGAFTGCERLVYLEMHQREGISCLREILQDLKQSVLVTCLSSCILKEKQLIWCLVYPEFFEEAVENTPARIISTQTHGMGIQYRNAFHNTQVVFSEYDKLFEIGRYHIDLKNVIEMVTARLHYPYALEKDARENYAIWLQKNLKEATEYFLEQEKLEELKWMAEEFVETREEFDILLQSANKKADTEALSQLMNILHRRFSKRKKSFTL